MAQNNAQGLNIYSETLYVSGDVDGYVDAVTVEDIQGFPVQSGETLQDGYVFTSNGSQWNVSPPTGFSSAPGGAYVLPCRTGTGNSTITNTDCIYVNTATTGSQTLTLPPQSPVGQKLIMATITTQLTVIPNSNIAGSSSNIVLAGTSSPSVGVNSLTLLCYDGSNWAVL